jgi:DNA-binding response OmpR family regulator
MLRLLLVAHEIEHFADWLTQATGERETELVCAKPGTEAELLLATDSFDALVVVPACPLEEGVALVRQLRTGGPNAEIPVIALAKELSCAKQVALRQAGVDVVLFLPCSVTSLRRCLGEVLDAPKRHVGVLEWLDKLAIGDRRLLTSGV